MKTNSNFLLALMSYSVLGLFVLMIDPLKVYYSIPHFFRSRVVLPDAPEDKDQLRIEKVPEPLTTLSSIIALGMGFAIKRTYSKRRKKTQT